MKLFRTFRWLITTALLLTGAAGGGAYWFFTKSDELLKAELLRQLAVMFPDADFQLERAHFELSGKVRAHQVTCTLHGEETPAMTIAGLVISLDRDQLADTQTVVIHKVRLIKPRVWATRGSDLAWNWIPFRIQRGEGGALPDVDIEQGELTVQLEPPGEGSIVTLNCTDLNLTALAASERSWSVQASGLMENIGQIQINGEGTVDRFPWKVNAQAKGLVIDQSLIAKLLLLRPDWRNHLDEAEAKLEKLASRSLDRPEPAAFANTASRKSLSLGKRGPEGIVQLGIQLLADITVEASQLDSQSPPDFHAAAVIQNGRITNPLLPLPLHDVTGRVTADRAGVEITDLSGQHGESVIECSATLSPTDHPMLNVHGRKIVIDEELTARLPFPLQKLVRSMSLAGICDFNAELVRTETGCIPKIDLALTRGRMTHEKFRYPVRDLEGTLEWRGDLAILEAKGLAGTAPVTVTGTIKHPGPGAEMVLLVQTKDMPIDSTLMEVSPAVVSKTIEALNLQGSGDVWAKLIKPAGIGEKWQTNIVARMRDCNLKYEKFPIRIDRASGLLRWNGETATFEDLQGYHADCRITGSGDYRRQPRGGRLELRLNATDAPLDAELHAALPLRLQHAWEEFRPQGRFDLQSHITWSPGGPVRVSLPAMTLKAAEVALKCFPFPWYNVSGKFRFEDDRLTVESLYAEHDDCRLRGEGTGDFAVDRPWQFRFTEFFVDDLPTTPALRRALPPELRAVTDALNPSGTISLQGPITFNGPDERRDEVGITWKTKVVLSGSDLTVGVPVDNIFGRVSIHGAWDGTQAVINHGALDIDSLDIFGHQLMHVQGPFRYQQGVLTAGSRQAVLGPIEQAAKSISWDEQISGKAIDGTLTLNGIVNFDKEPVYQLRLGMIGGNLEKYAQTYLNGQKDIRGNMNCWMDLHGEGIDSDRITGAGRLTISPAELYELPVFVQIFNVLGPQARDRSAFKLADFQFSVANSRFNIKKIDLNGPTIRLVGRGYVRFDGVISLEFYSSMPRNRLQIPIVSDVVSLMSGGLIGVTVSGHIKDPYVETRTIPVIDDTLRQFIGVFEPPRRSPAKRTVQPPPATRR